MEKLFTDQKTLVEDYKDTDQIVFNNGYVQVQKDILQKYNDIWKNIEEKLDDSNEDIQNLAMNSIKTMLNLLENFEPKGIVENDKLIVAYLSTWFSELTTILQSIKNKLSDKLKNNPEAKSVSDDITKIMGVVKKNFVPLEQRKLEVDKITHDYIIEWTSHSGEARKYVDALVKIGKQKEENDRIAIDIKKKVVAILSSIKDYMSQQFDTKITQLTNFKSVPILFGGSNPNEKDDLEDVKHNFLKYVRNEQHNMLIIKLMHLAEIDTNIVPHVITKFAEIKTTITGLLKAMQDIVKISENVIENDNFIKKAEQVMQRNVSGDYVHENMKAWYPSYVTTWKVIKSYLTDDSSLLYNGIVMKEAVEAFNTMTTKAFSFFDIKDVKIQQFSEGVKAIQQLDEKFKTHPSPDEELNNIVQKTAQMLRTKLKLHKT